MSFETENSTNICLIRPSNVALITSTRGVYLSHLATHQCIFHENQIMAVIVVPGLLFISEMSNEEKCVNETTSEDQGQYS